MREFMAVLPQNLTWEVITVQEEQNFEEIEEQIFEEIEEQVFEDIEEQDIQVSAETPLLEQKDQNILEQLSEDNTKPSENDINTEIKVSDFSFFNARSLEQPTQKDVLEASQLETLSNNQLFVGVIAFAIEQIRRNMPVFINSEALKEMARHNVPIQQLANLSESELQHLLNGNSQEANDIAEKCIRFNNQMHLN